MQGTCIIEIPNAGGLNDFMKMPKIFIRKLLLGIVLIGIAIGITVVIKESLDTQDPESALPIIKVEYNGTDVPAANIFRAGYEWNFFTTVERHAPVIAQEDLPLTPFDVQKEMPMRISFTKEPAAMRIWRADGRYSTNYIELASDNVAEFLTPSLKGVYVYKIKADWGSRGYIQYYFAIEVKE